MTRASRARVLLALVGSAALVATTVLASSSTAATAQSSLTVPTSPGKRVVSWTGNVPFGNGQIGLVADDPVGFCDPAKPQLNAQHTVKVTFPKSLSTTYDTLVRFSIHWKDT